MKFNFFDANAFLGTSIRAVYKPAVSGKDFLPTLNNFGVEKALVWHIRQYEDSPINGNEVLAKAISGCPQLFGVWAILPPQTKELPQGKKFFIRMKENRIFALRAFPDSHRFFLNKIVFGNFLEEVEKRRIPLLLSLNFAEPPLVERLPDTSWQSVYNLLSEFPKLVCILADLGPWGSDRYFRPLMERYPNVYIETSYFLQDGIMEALVRDFGAKRILFGSGFPYRDFGGPMLQLVHSDIAEKDKQAIAHDNLAKIIAEVKL